MSPVNCHDARTLLMSYLDSELDAATTLSVREHLRTCATCEERFDREERLERGLAAALRTGTMPGDVSHRLDAALEQLEQEVRSSPSRGASGAAAALTGAASGTGSVVGPGTMPGAGWRAHTWRWVAAAALALVALTLVLLDDGVTHAEAPAHVGTFVSAWQSAAEQLDLSSLPSASDIAAVRAMLDDAALSAFEFPSDGRVHDHVVHLLGARADSFDGIPVVNVLYDCCGELTSVFVMSENAVGGLAGGIQALQIPAQLDLRVEGVHTRTVVRDGLIIGVVSRHVSGLADQWSS